MASEGTKADWITLIKLLEKTVKELAARRAESARDALAEFVRRSSDAGCGALSETVKAQAEFLQRCVLPHWDGEAAATLDCSVGALLEKMQMESPGAQFDAGLKEIVSYLEQFEGDRQSEAGSADYVMDRVDWYRELLREDPSSVLFCELAEDLCARRLWQDAIRTLREGLYFHPRHVRGHALLGWALWEFGSAEQAEKVLNQVRSELEKCAVVYRVLGEIATHRGDMEEAGRLGNIHSLMQKGMDEPEAPWIPASIPQAVEIRVFRTRPEAKTATAPVRQSGGVTLPDFLGALKDRICVEGVAKAPSMTVFTAEDRWALEKLIHAQAGCL